MNNWIVAKFGGSSVKDGSAMLRCSHIVENNPDIKITIISATYNTTNQLEMVAKTAESGDEEMLSKVISELEIKHDNIAKELFSSNSVYVELKNLFDELKDISQKILTTKTFTPMLMDQLYSLGERMSSVIFADLLKLRMPRSKIVFVDARKIIKTNSDFRKAEPQIDLIHEMAEKELKKYLEDKDTVIVTQGFIGSDLLGNTTTLGREGSDYSAALLGEAINASLIQIWTDVEGIASSDPRFVENTKYIPELTFDEATALATLGAKVLFPRTLMPAKRKNIPVFVGSSLNPHKKGTMIGNFNEAESKLKAVTAQSTDLGNILSFVGNRLESNLGLIDKLKESLAQKIPSISLQDYTSVSISFKFQETTIHEAMKIGHEVLSAL